MRLDKDSAKGCKQEKQNEAVTPRVAIQNGEKEHFLNTLYSMCAVTN